MSNSVHHTCIISDGVELGKNNQILPYTTIFGPVSIGDNNIIGPNVVIGTPGQDTRNRYYDSADRPIKIGNNNIIREFTAIQKPCYEDITEIGNHVFIMQGVHIPHDAVVRDHAVLTPMNILGGIVTIMEGASVGIGTSIHQRSIIGSYSFISMGSVINKNVKPFCIYTEGKRLRLNRYGIEKFGFSEFQKEIQKYVLTDTPPQSTPVLDVVREFEELHKKSKRSLYA